ncbi:hypothetical protein BC833DRAFT_586717 [Globomyces pollinis-pini]|nr:hypothetical protein BC833DRAFT_586717 [Globomyces pollinis-pini]
MTQKGKEPERQQDKEKDKNSNDKQQSFKSTPLNPESWIPSKSSSNNFKSNNLHSAIDSVHQISYPSSSNSITNRSTIECHQNEIQDFQNHNLFEHSSVDIQHARTTSLLNQHPVGPVYNSQQDGQDVLNFLKSNTVTDSIYDDYTPRPVQCHPDTNFDSPQVTVASLLQDGQDIVQYLTLNRYATDIQDESMDSFDVTSMVQEFHLATETSESDPERLRRAVDRLQLFASHLRKGGLKGQ